MPIDSALAWLASHMRDNPAGYHEVALETLDRAHLMADDSLIAEAHDRLAGWHCFNVPFHRDSCNYHSEKKQAYLLKFGDSIQIANGYLTLTIDYLNSNRLEDGQETAFKAVDIFEALSDQAGLGRGYRILSSVFMIQEQPESSIEYARKAIGILEENPENEILGAITQLNLITSYNQLGQHQRAIAVADTCLGVVQEKYPEEFGILGRAYAFRGDAYLAIENYEKAVSDYTSAWKTVEAAVGPEGAVSYRTDIGKTLVAQGRYEEAIPHLQAGLNQMESTGTDLIWEVYKALSTAYQEMGNYEQALLNKDKYIKAYGTMLEGKVANLETEAAIKYETEKKDEALSDQAQIIAQQKRIQQLSWSIALILGALFAILFVLFQRIQKTAGALRVKNQENELLLREIHHRVKNNLAFVSSLLKLQALKTKDTEAKDAMEASQRRVQSMSILHQKLYQGENLSTIDMLDYFKNLSDKILDVFQAHDQVQIKLDMGDIDLDTDTAVPIGLIVNELLTNSLKYAFPEGKKGEIAIRLKETAANALELEVVDDGVGMQEANQPSGTGFGSQLIQLLTQQLQGTLTTDFSSGSRFLFQLERAIPR